MNPVWASKVPLLVGGRCSCERELRLLRLGMEATGSEKPKRRSLLGADRTSRLLWERHRREPPNHHQTHSTTPTPSSTSRTANGAIALSGEHIRLAPSSASGGYHNRNPSPPYYQVAKASVRSTSPCAGEAHRACQRQTGVASKC